jgi:hypothetical protein
LIVLLDMNKLLHQTSRKPEDKDANSKPDGMNARGAAAK